MMGNFIEYSPLKAVRLSVIMPVYNERYTLEEIVEKVLAQEKKPEISSIQLVIVDDASNDGSREIIERLSTKYHQIRAIFHQTNQGKAACIRTGIEHADGDVIVFQDADLEYDPAEYTRMLRPILDGIADVVYGSRFLVHEYRAVLYFWHYQLNRFLTTLSNMFTDLILTDMETCYKMFRAPLLKSIPIRSHGFGLEPEITAKIAKRRFRIYEVPISYRGRTYEEGKKINWRDGIWALYYIIKYWLIDDCFNDSVGEVLYSISKAPRFNRWLADVVRPYIGNSVLEIGAGIGNLTNFLLPRDFYLASDIDPVFLHTLALRFAGNKRVRVRRIDLRDSDTFAGIENSFDTVVCLNVLEHIEDDIKGLQNIYSALMPGGRAIILVPQGKWMYSKLDKVVGHYRRYEKDELATKMCKAGFQVENIFDFNRAGMIGWFTNKIRRKETLAKLELKIFDHLVWLFRLIDHFLPWHGLSVIAIGRKID